MHASPTTSCGDARRGENVFQAKINEARRRLGFVADNGLSQYDLYSAAEQAAAQQGRGNHQQHSVTPGYTSNHETSVMERHHGGQWHGSSIGYEAGRRSNDSATGSGGATSPWERVVSATDNGGSSAFGAQQFRTSAANNAASISDPAGAHTSASCSNGDIAEDDRTTRPAFDSNAGGAGYYGYDVNPAAPDNDYIDYNDSIDYEDHDDYGHGYRYGAGVGDGYDCAGADNSDNVDDGGINDAAASPAAASWGYVAASDGSGGDGGSGYYARPVTPPPATPSRQSREQRPTVGTTGIPMVATGSPIATSAVIGRQAGNDRHAREWQDRCADSNCSTGSVDSSAAAWWQNARNRAGRTHVPYRGTGSVASSAVVDPDSFCSVRDGGGSGVRGTGGGAGTGDARNDDRLSTRPGASSGNRDGNNRAGQGADSHQRPAGWQLPTGHTANAGGTPAWVAPRRGTRSPSPVATSAVCASSLAQQRQHEQGPDGAGFGAGVGVGGGVTAAGGNGRTRRDERGASVCAEANAGGVNGFATRGGSAGVQGRVSDKGRRGGAFDAPARTLAPTTAATGPLVGLDGQTQSAGGARIPTATLFLSGAAAIPPTASPAAPAHVPEPAAATAAAFRPWRVPQPAVAAGQAQALEAAGEAAPALTWGGRGNGNGGGVTASDDAASPQPYSVQDARALLQALAEQTLPTLGLQRQAASAASFTFPDAALPALQSHRRKVTLASQGARFNVMQATQAHGIACAGVRDVLSACAGLRVKNRGRLVGMVTSIAKAEEAVLASCWDAVATLITRRVGVALRKQACAVRWTLTDLASTVAATDSARKRLSDAVDARSAAAQAADVRVLQGLCAQWTQVVHTYTKLLTQGIALLGQVAAGACVAKPDSEDTHCSQGPAVEGGTQHPDAVAMATAARAAVTVLTALRDIMGNASTALANLHPAMRQHPGATQAEAVSPSSPADVVHAFRVLHHAIDECDKQVKGLVSRCATTSMGSPAAEALRRLLGYTSPVAQTSTVTISGNVLPPLLSTAMPQLSVSDQLDERQTTHGNAQSKQPISTHAVTTESHAPPASASTPDIPAVPAVSAVPAVPAVPADTAPVATAPVATAPAAPAPPLTSSMQKLETAFAEARARQKAASARIRALDTAVAAAAAAEKALSTTADIETRVRIGAQSAQVQAQAAAARAEAEVTGRLAQTFQSQLYQARVADVLHKLGVLYTQQHQWLQACTNLVHACTCRGRDIMTRMHADTAQHAAISTQATKHIAEQCTEAISRVRGVTANTLTSVFRALAETGGSCAIASGKAKRRALSLQALDREFDAVASAVAPTDQVIVISLAQQTQGALQNLFRATDNLTTASWAKACVIVASAVLNMPPWNDIVGSRLGDC